MSEKRYRLSDAEVHLDLVGFWRLVETHHLLAEGVYPNCRSLAARFEVHKRTAKRDIERLRDLFRAPIKYDPRITPKSSNRRELRCEV